MKYCKYILEFEGDPQIVAFLEKHVPRQWEGRGALGRARAAGRAAEALFPGKVRYKQPRSVTVARPQARSLKAL